MRFHFGDFCFDADRRELSERGVGIHLTPKASEPALGPPQPEVVNAPAR